MPHLHSVGTHFLEQGKILFNDTEVNYILPTNALDV